MNKKNDSDAIQNELDQLLNKKLFDNVSISDIFKKIYMSVEEENDLIKNTIGSILSVWANNPNDNLEEESIQQNSDLFGFTAPIIGDYIESSIKNNKLLIDLTTSIQRTIATITNKRGSISKLNDDDKNDVALTEDERKNLIQTVLKETKKIQANIDNNKKSREYDEQSRKKLFDG